MSRLLQNQFRAPAAERSFLFVLCPTYGGSTLMQELLSTAPQISPNNIFGTREGFALPEVRTLTEYRRLWEEDYQMDWSAIRLIWEQYWERYCPIALEKTPSNLMHASVIQQYFEPAYFILMTRDPYAHCESLIRRDQCSPTEAAQFSIQCLHKQRQNAEQLERVLLVRYEDLTDHLEESVQQIIQFLPALEYLDYTGVFKAHNASKESLPIRNLNQTNIERLSADQINEINVELMAHMDILSYFRYSIYE